MKCDACGAPVENGVCTYCGKEFHDDLLEEDRKEKVEEEPLKVAVNIVSVITPKAEKFSDSKGFWKKLGLVILWISFFPITLSVYYWQKSKLPNKQKTIILIAVWLLLFVIAGIDSCINGNDIANPSSASAAEHIYKNAEVKDILDGKVSVIHANQDDITDEVLSDWYKNYVSENDFNYCLIVFDDTDPTHGAYSTKTVVQKGVGLIPDDNVYRVGSDRGSTFYTIKDDKSLEPFYSEPTEEEANIIIETIDGFITDSFKGEGYAIDVGGDKNKLDASITLVNPSMDADTYQGATEYLAEKIKEANLPIGYMNVVFQSDKYSVKALSSVDDVTTYNGSSDVNIKNMS